MTDESESGEAYDKLANPRQRLAPGKSPPTKRRRQLSLELEARLVRAAMSNTLTLSRLAAQLGIKTSAATTYLKQLGLEKTILKDQTGKTHRTHQSRKTRRTLTHLVFLHRRKDTLNIPSVPSCKTRRRCRSESNRQFFPPSNRPLSALNRALRADYIHTPSGHARIRPVSGGGNRHQDRLQGIKKKNRPKRFQTEIDSQRGYHSWQIASQTCFSRKLDRELSRRTFDH